MPLPIVKPVPSPVSSLKKIDLLSMSGPKFLGHFASYFFTQFELRFTMLELRLYQVLSYFYTKLKLRLTRLKNDFANLNIGF